MRRKALLYMVAGVLACCLSVEGAPSGSLALQGRLEGNVYISPDRNFRIRVPPLLPSRIHIVDGHYGPERFSVEFSDDQCRVYIVTRKRGTPGHVSLQTWFEQHLIPELKQAGMLPERTEPVTTAAGPAMFLAGTQPGRAPCVRLVKNREGYLRTRPDAEVAMYIFHRGNYFYQLMYVVGKGTPQFSRTRPARVMLDRFLAGFELRR